MSGVSWSDEPVLLRDNVRVMHKNELLLEAGNIYMLKDGTLYLDYVHAKYIIDRNKSLESSYYHLALDEYDMVIQYEENENG